MYTMNDWTRDGTFSAKEGQEISGEIYEEMLNCMLPHTLPREMSKKAREKFKIPVHAGFLMGEPHCTNNKGEQLYLAFCKNNFGEDKYFYLGLSPKEDCLEGKYYFYVSIDADANGLRKASEFTLDEAIKRAQDKEASLYFREYKRGFLVRDDLLYEPQLL